MYLCMNLYQIFLNCQMDNFFISDEIYVKLLLPKSNLINDVRFLMMLILLLYEVA